MYNTSVPNETWPSWYYPFTLLSLLLLLLLLLPALLVCQCASLNPWQDEFARCNCSFTRRSAHATAVAREGCSSIQYSTATMAAHSGCTCLTSSNGDNNAFCHAAAANLNADATEVYQSCATTTRMTQSSQWTAVLVLQSAAACAQAQRCCASSVRPDLNKSQSCCLKPPPLCWWARTESWHVLTVVIFNAS